MTHPAATVPGTSSLEEVARCMVSHQIGSVLVVDDDGALAGIITDGDFGTKEIGIPFSTFEAPQVFGQWLDAEGVERIYRAARSLKARDVMSHPVHCVAEDDPLERILDVMRRRRVKHVPVVRGGVPVGIVTTRDLVKLLYDEVTARREPG